MKQFKTIILLLIICIPTYCFAKSSNRIDEAKVNDRLGDYAIYKMAYFYSKFSNDNNQFKIKIVKDQECTFFIESAEKELNEGEYVAHGYGGNYFVIDNVSSFINSLKNVKLKFLEWSRVAKTNNVVDYEKEMEIEFLPVTIAYYNSFWGFYEFYEGINIIAVYKIDDNGASRVEICTNTIKGGLFKPQKIVFTNEHEINNFIDAISPTKVKNKRNVQNQKDKLFH